MFESSHPDFARRSSVFRAKASFTIEYSPIDRFSVGELRRARPDFDAPNDLSSLDMWFVYLLRCADNNIYVGCTSNLDRLKRHIGKEVPATKLRVPVTLITYIAFTDKYKAFEFEKYLKGGSGRAFLNKRLV